MFCSKCGGGTHVQDVVQVKEDNETYRKRKCSNCGYIFYTTEFEVDSDDELFLEHWSKNHRTNKVKK